MITLMVVWMENYFNLKSYSDLYAGTAILDVVGMFCTYQLLKPLLACV